MTHDTIFSADRRYRYTLWRQWHNDYGFFNQPVHADSFVNFICLNPSTADETLDDPTIRKCMTFAKDWGYPAFCMTNIFAWRDTKPANMKKAAEPVGPDNDYWLHTVAKAAGVVVVGWGRHGVHLSRDDAVYFLMHDHKISLQCLRTNDDGSPEHPLYIPRKTELQPWPSANQK